MNKDNFLNELREKLSGLSQDDIDERVAFYSEMINDRMEDGLSEEEAVGKIGSVDSVVEQVMTEIPFTALVKERVKPKRKLKVWEIVLLILGSPLWLPLLISAGAILLSVYIVIWSVVITVYGITVSLGASAIGCFAGIFVYLANGNFAGAAFCAGCGLVCAGLAILMCIFSIWLTKAVIMATGKILLGIKKSFVGKGE